MLMLVVFVVSANVSVVVSASVGVLVVSASIGVLIVCASVGVLVV